jgi:V/A-type H+-transporting ATPase subunit I
LHYVEFFAQFYLGGKTKFEAFRAERSFTKVRR